MKKFVEPAIEVELFVTEDIMNISMEPGENESPFQPF